MSHQRTRLPFWRRWPDRKVEPILAAVASLTLLLIIGMVGFVFAKAWPSFAANGLSWFGSGGNIDKELAAIFNSPANPKDYVYTVHMWPLIWGTALTTAGALFFGFFLAMFGAIFMVEFAPAWLVRILDPVVKLLAAVPSVIYGLIGVLLLVPFVGQSLITAEQKESVQYVVQLNGSSILVAIVVLTIMVTPIMLALNVDAFRAVPGNWKEGAASLGVNRWRVMVTIVVRAARPAILAAAVLATARALGEAIMLSMVTGSVGFAPNPLDGLVFLYEPTRPLAATIVDNREGLSVVPFGQTLYAIAAVLLISAALLSLASWAIKQPMKKYGITA